ncbi:MAG: hypothetical protein JST62_01090 [Bacteroidetes bacterium]|nr:hypothetical protein [Bacteroidota bacterium]
MKNKKILPLVIIGLAIIYIFYKIKIVKPKKSAVVVNSSGTTPVGEYTSEQLSAASVASGLFSSMFGVKVLGDNVGNFSGNISGNFLSRINKIGSFKK